MGSTCSEGKSSVGLRSTSSSSSSSSSSACEHLPVTHSRGGGGRGRGSFHVFISFRGPDVRSTFLGHLYDALDRQGICAYIDSEDLQTGDEIAPSLKRAIEDSRIAIVIFSENYASSSWCLDELAKIVECRKRGELVLKPVFYRVEPREVRTPRYSYAKALAYYENKIGKDSDKLRSWRVALSEAGNLSGWCLDANGNEAEVIRNIVKDVNVLLDRTHLDVAKYPVGIESRVGEIENLLNMESDKVRLVGLWGMAGVGKTTLAKAVFNTVADQFDGCAFLPNVREDSANPSVGLARLQEKLLSEVLQRKDVTVGCIARGITRIRDRLGKKKILLLLDDISSTEQLDALAGGLNWFGNGSRILITTRDRSLIAAHNEHIVHKVEGLPDTLALQLFSKHAFPENDRLNITKDLVDRFLAYCDALPLALVVLGSLLRDREECYWRSTLELLEESPCEEIDKVLRVSYDGLDPNAREIFLYIACFFKGKYRGEIEKAVDACGFQSSLGIDKLIERSLITVVKDTICGLSIERVEMHDLLQLMCCRIVCQESPDDPSKRSRLWVYKHICDMLSNGTGTNLVKGLALQSPQPKKVRLGADALAKLKNLKLLIMENVDDDGDPICFPLELCWIELSGYSIPSTLFSYHQKPKQLNNLKCLRFHCCKYLQRIPDLTACPNLESLDILCCENLVEVDDSVGCLEKLLSLHLTYCPKLRKLPRRQKWRSLQTFTISDCFRLEKLPDAMVKMEFLEELSLSGCGIKELPASLQNLVAVREINLLHCKELVAIPCSIYKLQNLESFWLLGCLSLEKFPAYNEESTGFPSLLSLTISQCNLSEVEFLSNVNCFPKLRTLELKANHVIKEIPSLANFKNLEGLLIYNCSQLGDIAELPTNLCILETVGCRSLRRIKGLSVDRIANFDRINLSDSPILASEGIYKATILSLEQARKLRPNASFAFAGREMPDWLQQSHHPDSVSFLVPVDVCGGLSGILSCGVLEWQRYPVRESDETAQFAIQIFVGGQCMISICNEFNVSKESGMVMLQMLGIHNNDALRLSGYLREHRSYHFLVSLTITAPPGVVIKNCGLRLICKEEKDESRAILVEEGISLVEEGTDFGSCFGEEGVNGDGSARKKRRMKH